MHEERPNTGILFVNDRKESDNHPDWSGRGMIGGKPVWISAWKKEGQKGKYLSLSFRPREGDGKPREDKRDRRHPESRHDDDIPW